MRSIVIAAPCVLVQLLFAAGAAHAQRVADSIPFLPPEIHRADGSRILPHRIELEETTWYANDSTDIDSYTYVTVDAAQAWDERQLVIDWSALTWNGTGYDRNVVTMDGLALRGRITPSGVPFAYFIGSHYFTGVSTLVQVNPDGELQRYAPFESRATGVHNEIVYPYMLAAMNLREGMRFVVPAFNPYRASAPFQFRLFVVRGRITVEDEDGHTHGGWTVDAVSRDDLEAARAVADSFPDAHARYYVSSEAPYFLGKEWIDWRDGEGRTVRKRWRLTHHASAGVSSSRRLEEILRVRARRGAGQVVPWRAPGG